jgi:hypothetical protein
VGKYACGTNANALTLMHSVSTHPDYAALVDPLFGKPQRGVKIYEKNKNPLCKAEGGRAKQ